MPVKVLSGENAFLENCRMLKDFGSRCLIVCGGSSAEKSGALGDVRDFFARIGIEYCVFDRIEQNPRTQTARDAGDEAAAFSADFILGIGGGSPLDAAKAVAFYAKNPALQHYDIYTDFSKLERLPVALIGTTAGTGSEVTAVAVLTDSRDGKKKSICGDNSFADIAFCDAKYTHSMPYSVTVSTALDAFAHAVESFLALNRNEMSIVFAERAISLLWDSLVYFDKTGNPPDADRREKLYTASIFGGYSICVTGTLFPHALGYVLSEDYGIPHGKACTAFMPALIDFVLRDEDGKKRRCSRLFELCKTDCGTFKETIKRLTDVNIKMTAAEVEEYCKRWNDGTKNFLKTPGIMKLADAKQIMLDLFA